MRFFTFIFCLIFCGYLLSGCASIVSHTNWPLSVQSDPVGARVTITNRKGNVVFQGTTPTAMKLKSGAGFFAKESYVVELALNGYETKKLNVECKLNSWYFGNILLGGVIGMLIVDPATGAMYKLDNKLGVNEILRRSKTVSANSGPLLQIIDKKDIPAAMQQHLLLIKP